MNILSSSRSLLNRLHKQTQIDPVRDWFVLLTVFVLALASIIVWNVWTFDRVASGGVIGRVELPTSAVFNQTSLDTVRTIFENRASEEAKYRTGVYQYTDPSP